MADLPVAAAKANDRACTGAGAASTPTPPASPAPVPCRVTYARGPVVEWYDNGPEGLEQGFTLADRPEGMGQLRLEGRIEADAAAAGLTARFDPRDEAIEVIDAGGRCWLRYSKLLAYDARGRRLPSKLDLVESRGARGDVAAEADRDAKEGCAFIVRISVDDTDAAYPITIDPLLNSPAWMRRATRTPPSTAARSRPRRANADGYSVLVGAVSATTARGRRTRLPLPRLRRRARRRPRLDSRATRTAHFGESVAAAGDVNGDGYDDVVIAPPTRQRTADEAGLTSAAPPRASTPPPRGRASRTRQQHYGIRGGRRRRECRQLHADI
jgi:hypothetical protein